MRNKTNLGNMRSGCLRWEMVASAALTTSSGGNRITELPGLCMVNKTTSQDILPQQGPEPLLHGDGLWSSNPLCRENQLN